MEENKEFKIGDIVEHKILPGKFLICRCKGFRAVYDFTLIDKNGKTWDVDKEELK